MRNNRSTFLGLAAGTGIAALAGFNRYVAGQVEELEPRLSAAAHDYDWRYGRVTYYEDGPEDGPVLVMIHGHDAAGSAYELIEPFKRLRDKYHIYAPDLLGYGLSDRPAIRYSAETYIELIRDFLREVVRKPAPVLALSLSGAHAIQVAADDPEWITHLTLVAPTGLGRQESQRPDGKLLEELFRTPIVGEALFNLLASRYYIRQFLETQAYYDPMNVTAELVEEGYKSSHQPGARFAPAAFVGGSLTHAVRDAWPRVGQPVLLVWGEQAKIAPLSDAAAFLALNPGAELETIGQAGLVPQDEQPDEFARIYRSWLERSGAG